jgi:alpha-ketoglutarate-dependent taurine dioxygenase
MNKTPVVQNFGLEITDVDVSELTDDGLRDVLSDLAAYGLLLFRKQVLDDEALYAFSLRIGALEEPARKIVHSPDNSCVGYLTNLLRPEGTPLGFGGNSTDYWHSDQEYRQNPATLATLYCLIAPRTGGTTSFASTLVRNLRLPYDVLSRLAGCRATYIAAATHDNVDRIEVAHPALLSRADSTQQSVYVSGNTVRFIGLPATEGETLKATVMASILRPENIYAHHWRMGDLILYDNTQLLHRRDAFEGIRWLKATKIFAPAERFAVPRGLVCESASV